MKKIRKLVNEQSTLSLFISFLFIGLCWLYSEIGANSAKGYKAHLESYKSLAQGKYRRSLAMLQ